MEKFLDGSVNFDLYDYEGQYVPLYRYYRLVFDLRTKIVYKYRIFYFCLGKTVVVLR